MRVSIVIPTHNEEKYLEATLKSIYSQSLKPDEIIIADYKSKDKTLEIAKKYNCKVLNLEKAGIGLGRAEGSKIARGDIIVMASSDAVYDKNWLRNLIKPIIDDEADISIGSIYLKKGKNAIEKIGENILNRYVIPFVYFINLVYASGDSIAIKSKLYHKIGGINPKLNTGEDTDLVKRAKKHGNIIYVPEAITYTSDRRIKKWGVAKYVVFHTINFLKVNLLNKANDKYEAIR